ncbi:hypothetical protein BYT27DRAFT_7249255 [Phlegmacium glaucopus]|nr:hypothetical protein BYT27DRAFT_7249255 [Phlegmacium glaucopus]
MLPSKNLLPPPFAPTQPSTCTKNRDAQPGAIDMPKPRRTAAEMQAIRDQQASDKQEKKVTVPTTGSKSAAQYSKRDWSPSVSLSQTVQAKKLKRSNQMTSGLRSGWDSMDKTKPSAPAAKSHQEDNDSLVRYGGMVSDDSDDEERSAIMSDKGPKRSPNNYSSSLKIEVKLSVPRTQREAWGGSGKKWRLEHRPKNTSDAFTNQLVPLAKSLAGSLSLWEGFSRKQVQELVDKVYGPAQYTIQNPPIDPWAPLISYCLNNWHNGFGTKAAEVLRRYIEVDQAEFFKNPKVIADWVQFSLAPDGNPPTYPFLWKEWKINNETGKVTKKGRLQNPLVLYTLALAHFAEWEDVPDLEHLSEKEKPHGAFILSLQAVQYFTVPHASERNPSGVRAFRLDSQWIPSGVRVESWIPNGVHSDSTWTLLGVQVTK